MPLCWLIGFYGLVIAGVVLVMTLRRVRQMVADRNRARLPSRIEMALRDLGRRGLVDEIRTLIFYNSGVRYAEQEIRSALERLVADGRLRWDWSAHFSCYGWKPVQVYELMDPASG